MRSISAVPLLVVSVGLALVAALPVTAQRTPIVDTQTAVPVQVITRERLNRDISVLTLINTVPKPFDELRMNLPSDKPVSAGSLPDGWTLQQRGKQIRTTGPAIDGGRFRFDVSNVKITDFTNKNTTVELYSGGSPGAEYRSVFTAIDAVNVTPNLEGIFTATPYGTPGQPLTIGVGDGYRDGSWQFKLDGGGTWPIARPTELPQPKYRPLLNAALELFDRRLLERLVKQDEPRPFVTTFPDRPITGVTYIDPWRETVVDAPLKIEAATPQASCQAGLTGGSPFAFAGQAACVSGCFPDYGSLYDLKLNDTFKLSPWAYSPTSVMLGIPADTKPGPYTIGGPGIGGTVQVGVLALEGNIDTNSLWKGQSTTMRLRILGTDKPLPIVVLNRTPGIISLEGGVHQTITTPGGADNAVTRSVRGIHRGNFQITYSLSAPGCGARSGS